METSPGARRSAAFVPTVAALVLFTFGIYPLANQIYGVSAVPWYPHALRLWCVIGTLLLLALLALCRLFTGPLDRAWSALSSRIMRIPTPVYVGAFALFAFAASAVISVICFGAQPHNSDEVAQLFHARILLSGHLTLPVDPNPEFFGMDNMIDTGRWYSQFPIGGPAFLAIGVALRVAWLLNPALLGLTVIALHRLARGAYDEATARAAVALLALSPFALFVSASYMNHVPVLWLATVAMAQLTVWVKAEGGRSRGRSAAIIGLALGAAFAIRPLDALVAAGVIGMIQLAELRSNPARGTSLLWQVAAGLVPVLLLFIVNARTNGAPLRLGYDVLYGSAHGLGFHVDPYGSEHTPTRAVVLASKYLLQLNVLLFGWPLPALGVIVVGLFALRRPSRWDFLLIEWLLVQLICYALYWHDGSFRGPRFLFTALPAIVLLAARAPFLVAQRSRGAVRLAAIYALPLCTLFVWTVSAAGTSMSNQVRQYRSAPAIGRVNPERLARDAGLHDALVFINEGHQARNLHYLWALGLSRGNAARMMVTASPCAVRIAIDEEQAIRPARTGGRLDRLALRAIALDKQQSATLPAECIAEAKRDDIGTASYAPFFPVNEIDSTGHVGGDVVYALDLGSHNEVLRSRFGSRRWYRFGPRKSPRDSLPSLIPYSDAP